MLINSDFSRRAVVVPSEYRWTPSPQPGVERVMLDRVGGEKARATSIVRYAPASRFPRHEHPGGEEILVLSGTFSDADGHYTEGCYLRNPPGSSHQPYSEEGCVLFVKLWQMPAGEQRRVRIDTRAASDWEPSGASEVLRLFDGPGESVALERLAPGALISRRHEQSIELLVLTGNLQFEGSAHRQDTWIRLPAGDDGSVAAGEEGATLWRKIAQPC